METFYEAFFLASPLWSRESVAFEDQTVEQGIEGEDSVKLKRNVEANLFLETLSYTNHTILKNNSIIDYYPKFYTFE